MEVSKVESVVFDLSPCRGIVGVGANLELQYNDDVTGQNYCIQSPLPAGNRILSSNSPH